MREVTFEEPTGHRALADAHAGVSRTALFVFSCAVPLDVFAFGHGSITAALGPMLVAAFGWHVIAGGRLRAPDATIGLLTAFTAWALASLLFWARDLDGAELRVRTYLQLLAFAWIAWQLTRSRADLRAMAAGYLVGCTIAAALTWRAFLAGEALSEWETRFAAEGFDPNDLGVTIALGIPVAAYLARGRVTPQRAWLAYLPVALSAIALSGSRGAALTTSVALAFVLWDARRSPRSFAALLLAGAASVALASEFVPLAPVLRMLGLAQASSDLGGRGAIWRAGAEVFWSAPVVGVGAGGFPHSVMPRLGAEYAAHNAFIGVAVELGMIGLLLFTGAAAVASRALTYRRSSEAMLTIRLLATWMVAASSLTWDYRKTTWLVLLLAAAARSMARDEAAETS